MSGTASLRAVLAEVNRAGGCTHPVRLKGTTLDRDTGELWEGTVPVACKDRRSAVCPACAARYRADAWHLVAAGLRGGKGVPAGVAAHPVCFVTLTAPSFGPVHGRRDTGPCHPRRRAVTCPHGTVLACTTRHGPGDPVLGRPLCEGCFDYRRAVLWNAHVGKLWNRTTVLVRRGLARAGGCSERAARAHLRVAYVKVAEFQRRGLVHLHVVVRLDGADGPSAAPPPWATVGVLDAVVREAAASAAVPVVGGAGRVGWGGELDVAVVGMGDPGAGPADPGALAAYLAKYAVKSSEPTGVLARRLRSVDDPALGRLATHPARLVRTAWAMGTEPALGPLRLRAHAHTFGYPGHFATKSQRYSTTFGALRAARVEHRAGDRDQEGTFWFAGHGYPSPAAARLAEALAAAPRPVRRASPAGSPAPSPTVPHPGDQG